MKCDDSIFNKTYLIRNKARILFLIVLLYWKLTHRLINIYKQFVKLFYYKLISRKHTCLAIELDNIEMLL